MRIHLCLLALLLSSSVVRAEPVAEIHAAQVAQISNTDSSPTVTAALSDLEEPPLDLTLSNRSREEAEIKSWINDPKWYPTDIALEVLTDALILLDWAQTRDLVHRQNQSKQRWQNPNDNPHKLVEINPLLGAHPSMSSVNTYFFSVLGGKLLVAYFLPKGYRRGINGVVLGVEAGITVGNANLGLNASF